MMEGLTACLKQLIVFLGCIQVCFIYYFPIKNRWFGKFRTWMLTSFIIYFGLLVFKRVFGIRLLPYMLCMCLLNIVVVYMFYDVSFRGSLFWASMQYVIAAPVEVTAIGLSVLVQKVSVMDIYEYSDVLLGSKLIMNIVFMIYTILFMIIWRLHKRRGIRKNDFVLYMMIPLYQVLLLSGYLPGCDISKTLNALIGCLIAIFSILIDFSVILVIDHLNERVQKEEELYMLEKKRKQELQYLEQNMRKLEEMRLVRHDLGNQLQTLSAMMEAEEERETIKLMIGDVKDRVKLLN